MDKGEIKFSKFNHKRMKQVKSITPESARVIFAAVRERRQQIDQRLAAGEILNSFDRNYLNALVNLKGKIAVAI